MTIPAKVYIKKAYIREFDNEAIFRYTNDKRPDKLF